MFGDTGINVYLGLDQRSTRRAADRNLADYRKSFCAQFKTVGHSLVSRRARETEWLIAIRRG